MCHSYPMLSFIFSDDPCISNPCLSGGTCVNEAVNGTYICECTYDKIGIHCEFGKNTILKLGAGAVK